MDRPWTRHYEPEVPADLALRELTVVDFLEEAARRWPDRPAVTFKGRSLTWAALRAEVERCAAGLEQLGVGRGSRVALWLPNLPQMLIGTFATLRLGAQAVPTNPLYVERELEHQFNDAGVSVVITLDFLWQKRLRGILDRTRVEHVVVGSIPDYLPFPLNVLAPLKLRRTGQWARVAREPRVKFFRELLAGAPAAPRAPRPTLDDPALLQYTGGTTGVAKGAVLTHRNLSANAQQSAAWFPIATPGEEVLLACLPYFHIFGMTVAMLWPVVCGFHIVLAPNPRDIDDLVRCITKRRVTIFPAVPALFTAICDHPRIDRLDVSSVKGCFSGSAPLPVAVIERFEQLTGGLITEGFGLTEASPVTHANPLRGLRKPGSVGLPLPGTDARVVDVETGTRTLGPNEEGELVVRGPQVMAGYWNRPDETALVLRDGWLHTGDLARIDEDGFCFIVGRKKDLIIVGGFNVYPDEVDRVLAAHPAVSESATVGVPDAKRGEAVVSYVVRRPGAAVDEGALRDYCRTQLAAYKVPRRIEFVASLPKSSMMKIMRSELRAQAAAGG